MQKLEEVLRAEEAARHVANDARDRSSAILVEAEVEAKRITHSSRELVMRESEKLLERALEDAAEQVAAIEASAAAAVESTTQTARSRMSKAVQVALDELLS